jgi:hypothetical protein
MLAWPFDGLACDRPNMSWWGGRYAIELPITTVTVFASSASRAKVSGYKNSGLQAQY